MQLSDDKFKVIQLAPLSRTAVNFSVSVYLRKYLLISGGHNGNQNNAIKSVSMLELTSHKEQALPDLNQARFRHSSIVLDKYLYAIGGLISASQYSSSIESLDMV